MPTFTQAAFTPEFEKRVIDAGKENHNEKKRFTKFSMND